MTTFVSIVVSVAGWTVLTLIARDCIRERSRCWAVSWVCIFLALKLFLFGVVPFIYIEFFGEPKLVHAPLQTLTPAFTLFLLETVLTWVPLRMLRHRIGVALRLGAGRRPSVAEATLGIGIITMWCFAVSMRKGYFGEAAIAGLGLLTDWLPFGIVLVVCCVFDTAFARRFRYILIAALLMIILSVVVPLGGRGYIFIPVAFTILGLLHVGNVAPTWVRFGGGLIAVMLLGVVGSYAVSGIRAQVYYTGTRASITDIKRSSQYSDLDPVGTVINRLAAGLQSTEFVIENRTMFISRGRMEVFGLVAGSSISRRVNPLGSVADRYNQDGVSPGTQLAYLISGFGYGLAWPSIVDFYLGFGVIGVALSGALLSVVIAGWLLAMRTFARSWPRVCVAFVIGNIGSGILAYETAGKMFTALIWNSIVLFGIASVSARVLFRSGSSEPQRVGWKYSDSAAAAKPKPLAAKISRRGARR